MLSSNQKKLRVALFALSGFFSGLLLIMGISSNFATSEMSAKITDLMFTNIFPVAAFAFSITLVYIPYLEGLELQNYTKHKQLGKQYVPNIKFDEAIRAIELNRGLEVSRKVSHYTQSKTDSDRLLLQIEEVCNEPPKFEYDYKTDSWHYYISVNGKIISGETGSKAMAICIMYVELFE